MTEDILYTFTGKEAGPERDTTVCAIAGKFKPNQLAHKVMFKMYKTLICFIAGDALFNLFLIHFECN